MRVRSALVHTAQAVLEGSLIALLVVGLMAGSVFAAKGGGKPGGGSGTTSTLNLVMVDDANANGAPNYGDTVTFSASTSVSKPMVGLRCYQGTTFVYDGYVALFDTWLSQDLTLVSSQWDTAADASCTARLFYYDNRSREQVLTTISFTVAP
jgi:hypothetical protein